MAHHPLGLIYHLSSWKEALERAFRHIKGHFLVLRNGSGKIIAGMPVYVVRSWLLGNRIVSIPYASICDPLISSAEHYKQLLPALTALQKETSSHSIEIRTIKTKIYTDSSSAPDSVVFLHHYLPLNKPPEILQNSFSRTSVRQTINKSLRKGISVNVRNDEAALKLFYSLFVISRKKLCLPPIPFKFFHSLFLKFVPDNMALFFSFYEGEIIGALLTLEFNKMLHLEYSGVFYGTNDEGASRLLYWEAIKYGWSKGYKYLSFGRTYPWDSGLLQYKRRWATIEEPIVISRILARRKRAPIEYRSAKHNIAYRWIFGHSPQLLCDALASFIYRHHG